MEREESKAANKPPGAGAEQSRRKKTQGQASHWHLAQPGWSTNPAVLQGSAQSLLRALHSDLFGQFSWNRGVLQKGRYVLTESWLCYNEWIWKNWNTANAKNARKIVFLPWRGQKQTLINFLPLIHLDFTDGADQFFCIKLHWSDSVEWHQHKSDSGNKRVFSACFPASFSQTLQSAFNFFQWNGKFYRKPAKVEPEDKNLDGLNLW